MSEIKESKSETPSELENRELAEMEAACSSMNISTCQQQKSVFTVASKSQFNIEAPPFEMPPMRSMSDLPKIKVGPSAVEVNSNIWSAIASNRPLPVLNRMPNLPISSPTTIQTCQHCPQVPMIPSLYPMLSTNTNTFDYGFNNPPLFEDDYSRNLVFTRNYGPVAHLDGYVEFRLHESITIYISVNRSILIRNPKAKVTIAVSHDLMNSAIEHPNGKVYQTNGSIDMICFDGTKKMNNFIRYAKMWEKGISLTAEGCALIYLVDNAGSRTTSDAVNKDNVTDYCLKVFYENSNLGSHLFPEAEVACNSYHFATQKDGSHVFDILGYRISQTTDGMVQVSRQNNRLKIHTSPSNGSARLSTPFVHSTASMGRSSHLFVRHEERRMHFDGTQIVVRNQGHSAGFDEDNNLRIY